MYVYLRTRYLELGTLHLSLSAESLRVVTHPPAPPKIKVTPCTQMQTSALLRSSMSLNDAACDHAGNIYWHNNEFPTLGNYYTNTPSTPSTLT
jgi:hypothetical protein